MAARRDQPRYRAQCSGECEVLNSNMVVLEGDAVGQVVLRGAGAGEGPTASAVMGDVMDIARGLRLPVFGQPAATLRKAQAASARTPAPYYLRLNLQDKPGALAKVAALPASAPVAIGVSVQAAVFGAPAIFTFATDQVRPG